MACGKVTDRTRLERAAPTIQDLTKKGAKVLLLSHFGRPKGKPNPEMSLRPLVPEIASVLGRDVAFAEDCIGAPAEKVARGLDRKSTRLNSSHYCASRMPSSA